ncbi:MAG: hypothetical protein IJ344_04910 [Clostridia bacterium]|nr:hypothetical protein [Clostridia bacterium]
MSICCLKEHIRAYLKGEISREELDAHLDKLHDDCVRRQKNDLFFEDLFLSSLLPHLTAIPEQAYSDSELRRLLEMLDKKEPLALPCFITVTPLHLSDRDLQILCLAEDYLKKGEVPQSPLFENKRYEFEIPKTLPALMAKDLLYLLWMAKKPQWVLFRKGLDHDDLKGKIERQVSLLSGRQTAFVQVGVDHASVL